MKINFFIALFGILLVMLFTSIHFQQKEIKDKDIQDSIDNRYYKKQLESYPYEHSEIKDTTVKN
jgi:hypothetical protein